MSKRKIRIHFLVPTEKAPAPHMQSGEVRTGEKTLGNIGQNRANACACNPTLVLSEWDRGTGDWWAVACRECGATEVFKEAVATIPHPSNPSDSNRAEVEDMRGCC